MWLDKYIKEVNLSTDFPIFNGREFVCTRLYATDLFLCQYLNEEFNALDVVVKYIAIECYYGINDYGMELYRKMQTKRVNEDWTERFKELIKSFENGIDMDSWIKTDVHYSIHDGAHRLALALYHGCKIVPVKVFNVEISRRYYGINWFIENGFTNQEIKIILDKLNEILEKCRKPYYCILWTPARREYEYIEHMITRVETGVHILGSSSMYLKQDTLKDFIYQVYETDDIARYKLDLKYSHMMESLSSEHYNLATYCVRIIMLKIDNPDFRLKPLTGLPQSRTTMRLKVKIRDDIKTRIVQYYHDITMHITDNQIQNEAIEQILLKHKEELL